MSTEEKEAKRLAELRLAGNDSEDARAAVMAQRELKKKRDALRKAEKKLKGTKPEDNAEAHREAAAAVEEASAAVQALEEKIAVLTGASPVAAVPPVRSPSPSPPATAASAEKETKKETEMRFVGQNSNEARAAVKAQRELKKKRDALRKVQKELKAANAAEKPDFAEQREKEAALLKEITTLEAIGGGARIEAPPTATKTGSSSVSPAAAAAPLAKNPATSAKGTTEEAKVITEEERAATAAKLRSLVQRAMEENRLECTHVTRRDGVVHPRIAECALLMEQMLLVGGSARVLALVSAFRELIKSTTVLAVPTLNEVDTTAFEKLIQVNFDFVRRKREASAGMRFAKDTLVRRFVALRDEVIHPKPQVAAFINDLGNPREVTLKILDMIEGELTMSFKSIVEDRSLPYVSSNDTILVFGRSSVVEYILLSRSRVPECKPRGIFVVDCAPLFEGRQLADKLSTAGMEVTYCLITACCTVMPKCTRVFLGASAVLQNGDLFGRCGMALVAACAKLFRKPVLCFSESYKFVPEVWVGNLAQNTKLADMRPSAAGAADVHSSEAGTRSPLGFPSPPTLSPPQLRASSGWGTPNRLGDIFARGANVMPFSSNASGYLYDLTPASYVDMIICEMGCLHTSAIVAAIKDRESREVSQLAYLTRN